MIHVASVDLTSSLDEVVGQVLQILGKLHRELIKRTPSKSRFCNEMLHGHARHGNLNS